MIVPKLVEHVFEQLEVPCRRRRSLCHRRLLRRFASRIPDIFARREVDIVLANKRAERLDILQRVAVFLRRKVFCRHRGSLCVSMVH